MFLRFNSTSNIDPSSTEGIPTPSYLNNYTSLYLLFGGVVTLIRWDLLPCSRRPRPQRLDFLPRTPRPWCRGLPHTTVETPSPVLLRTTVYNSLDVQPGSMTRTVRERDGPPASHPLHYDCSCPSLEDSFSFVRPSRRPPTSVLVCCLCFLVQERGRRSGRERELTDRTVSDDPS